MGWAKYAEDNMEMWEERFYRPLKEERCSSDAIIQVCTILPVVSLPVELSIKVKQEGATKSGQTLRCKDCRKKFVFTEQGQDFYQLMGCCSPKRCNKCRKLKKAKYADCAARSV